MDASHDVNWHTFASDADRKRMDDVEKLFNPKPRTHVAPMVTLTRLVDGVPDGSIRVRGGVGENGAVTVDAPEFFAPRSCDEGKKVTFTASVSLSGVPHRDPIPALLRSHLTGYARALAALQKRGLR